MTTTTICNHFTSVLAEYGLPATIITDYGSQYVRKAFKQMCNYSNIKLIYSSPYHHQGNSLAERMIGTCKQLLKKATESNQFPYTAIWTYTIR